MDPVQAFLRANAIEIPLFASNSRYYGIDSAEYALPDGTKIAYVRRRFVPAPESLALLQEHTITRGERLDQLAGRYFGDPQLYWRICDANRAMRPDELIEVAGRWLRITLPEGVPGVTDAG
jgi:nucleoid-associated protein YgaU